VSSPKGELLGTVVDFSSNGAQDLLVIENSDLRFEAPLVEAYICDMNFEKKALVLDLPEGLIDLYKSSK
ncbi:MAG: ribosome maturation factor RimM, partial [Bdellovibrionales bacterium]|nr:ribosome maturation factor RimM [Bdellovibrionales bacterium]